MLKVNWQLVTVLMAIFVQTATAFQWAGRVSARLESLEKAVAFEKLEERVKHLEDLHMKE